MAAAPLTTGASAPNPALNQLIDSLADNAPVTPPSAWPPPPVFWAGLILLLVIVAALGVWWWRGRHRRRYLRALKQLQRRPDIEAIAALHRLLRNAAARQDSAYRALSDAAFARLIAEGLDIDRPPAWVNAHYRRDDDITVDWRQARLLVRRWCL